MISLQLKIFCALHRPQGKWQVGYHLLIISLSFIVGFCLNVLNLEGNQVTLQMTMYIDCFLTIILLSETVAQLVCCSYKPYYCEWRGKLHYLRDHWVSKTVDLFGIVSYISYVTELATGVNVGSNATSASTAWTPIISFGHMLQILQLYRLTHRQMRLMVRTIHYQFGYLFSIILFTVAIFLVISRCVYLLERDANPNITNIFDASWLVLVTIICIGFGDKVPVTTEGKLFMIFAAYYGIVSFSILVSLFGAQLAKEKEKPSVISLMPAASLIQNVWVLHSMKSGNFWSKKSSLVVLSNAGGGPGSAASAGAGQQKQQQQRQLSSLDKRAIICLQKVRYLVSSRHLKLSQGDVTAFDENILLYEHLLNRLDFIEKNIYHNSYTLNTLNEELQTVAAELQVVTAR